MWEYRKLACIGLVILSLCSGVLFSSEKAIDVTVTEGTRISLRLNDYLSTKLNREGDRFTADVLVPIMINDRLVIPKGSVVSGSISRIIRPGRIRGKAVMDVLFHSIRIPGKSEISIVASLATVDPDGKVGKDEGSIQGDSSKGRVAARDATPGLGGAGIGKIIGGGKGAAIGGGVGAVIGLATVFSTRGKDLEVRRGSTLDIVLERPLVVSVDPDGSASKNR